MSACTVTIDRYPTGALSFLIDSPTWPITAFSRASLLPMYINSPKLDAKTADFLKELSLVIGIRKEPVILRPNGFNIIPEDGFNLSAVVSAIQAVLTRLYQLTEFKIECPLK